MAVLSFFANRSACQGNAREMHELTCPVHKTWSNLVAFFLLSQLMLPKTSAMCRTGGKLHEVGNPSQAQLEHFNHPEGSNTVKSRSTTLRQSKYSSIAAQACTTCRPKTILAINMQFHTGVAALYNFAMQCHAMLCHAMLCYAMLC